MENKILIVDDDVDIADLIEIYLKNEGYKTFKAVKGEEVFELNEKHQFQLIILDIMMPGLDGYEICRRIRKISNIPILMLSAKTEDIDKILGLSTGADDYLTKPFNPLELIARVKSQIRRFVNYNNAKNDDVSEITIGELTINKNNRVVKLSGERIALTPKEYDILILLINNRGKTFSSEELFEKVWGEKYFEANNTISVHIWNLREKIERNPKEPMVVKTIWGVGYTIDE